MNEANEAIKEVRMNEIMYRVAEAEVRDLMEISKSHQHQSDTAKTPFKKQYFKKKLVKNNKDLAEMLVRLSQLPEPETETKDE